MEHENRNLLTSAILLGLGAGGAIDGILFHQLLQWHHMLDHDHVGLAIFTDGLFTILFSALLLWGGVNIFRHAQRGELGTSLRTFTSGILMGAGAFNLIEGIIDHHILQLHRVRPASENPLLYDIAFLLIGLILFLIGWALHPKEE
ncbi:DUF2243 domain-containing protein [Bacillus marinisedimentorum]|uniref:DUF2243 domain-containing protein n=1 Tax=Bacillus marinisedimentorum TaxID=1821260 RepID=UPI000871EE92|nr:DUF2243 domain-containing protein [Bacillus marinisedimentorum]